MRVAALALSVLLLPAVTASAQPVALCPTLPPESGLEWKYLDGPDFGICYAMHAATKADAFGIYLGNFPSFNPAKGIKVATGTLAGKEVVWYRGFGNDDQSQDRVWQTVLQLGNSYTSVAHVWVDASDEQRLQRCLTILERIVFKPSG